MKIQKISVKNYRALEDISIDFNTHMNLIYGANAVGKTSILQLIYHILLLNRRCKSLSCDYHVFQDEHIIDPKQAVEAELYFENGKSIKVKRESSYFIEKNSLQENKALDQENPQPKIKENLDITKSDTLYDGTVISGDKDFFYTYPLHFTLFAYSVDRLLFYNAYEEHYNYFTNKIIELYAQEQSLQKENSEYKEIALEKVRDALKYLNASFSDIFVDYSGENPSLYLIKNGKNLHIDQLSTGERGLLVALASLCLYSFESEDSMLVLIDEVDTSLHPTWQVKVLDILKNILPDTQFIISSHSPFIWMGAKKDEIIHLVKDEEQKTFVSEVSYASGGNLESIARNYFSLEAYSDEARKDLLDIDASLADKDLVLAKAQIEAFSKKYGEEIPALSRLRTKLRIASR